jgi:hypothetical protein
MKLVKSAKSRILDSSSMERWAGKMKKTQNCVGPFKIEDKRERERERERRDGTRWKRVG